MLSALPAGLGAGSPLTLVEAPQLPAVICVGLYRTMYVDAEPVLPSSPGAVHVRSTVPGALPVLADRSVIAAGAVVSAAIAAIALGLLETPDRLGTSSRVLMANQYVCPPVSPGTVMLSALPAGPGAGSPVTFVEAPQLPVVICVVLYRTMYVDAVPELPSSPGAVQLKSTVPTVLPALADRSPIAAGAIVSTPHMNPAQISMFPALIGPTTGWPSVLSRV